jgi:hypothetical protein
MDRAIFRPRTPGQIQEMAAIRKELGLGVEEFLERWIKLGDVRYFTAG